MEHIIMSRKEIDQVALFDKLRAKSLTQVAVAKILGITDRAVRKRFNRYKLFGIPGLVHKSRGRTSKRQWYGDHRTQALRLLEGQFKGFGPTFAAEKLKELHGIVVSKECLRKTMIQTGLWTSKTIKPVHRSRRPRRVSFGMMIQLDGSPHDWFEGRGPWCTLLVFIDDATSKIVWLEFAESESMIGVMKATRGYLNTFGRPISFYVDFGGVFSVNTNNPDREKLSQFERAMKEFEIEVIHALSPQAKGRVERANKTLQDRLVKELRLAGVSTIGAANVFVQGKYLEQHNAKFAIEAADPVDVHRPIVGYNLEEILCKKERRVLQNDFIVAYNKRLFQLTEQQKAVIRPKEEIIVSEHLDGKTSLWIRGIKLNFIELARRPLKPLLPQEENVQIKHNSPAWNHPWRKPWAHGLSHTPLSERRVG